LKVNGRVTEPAANSARLWRFGECEFDELRYEMRVRGRVVELERKPLDVLLCLLSRAGEVVRKEELLDCVWPGVMVVDASLATAVSKLRKALDDQDVIQTVPKVGYRISVAVRSSLAAWEIPLPDPVSAPGPSPDIEPLIAPPDIPAVGAPRGHLSLRWILGAALLVLLSAVFMAIRHDSKPDLTPPVIAILPFQNFSTNTELDFLKAALPDEVANTLGLARSVTIRPLSASARFAGPSVDFREAARALDANRIVTGHYLVAGDQLQITMEAVDPAEDRVLWRESVNVPSRNLLELQQQIAAMSRWKLAHALGITEFVPELIPRATNEEAYELYLKSVALEYDPRSNQKAIQLLRRTVELDPGYAPAWGNLSLRYYNLSRFGGGGPAMLAFSDAAAERELALDPDSPTPAAELAIHRTERGELVKAHQTALELLRRRPDNPNNHHVLSYVLRYGGSLDQSARECDLVLLLATRFVWGACSTTFMELGDYNRALGLLRKDLSSDFSKAHAIDIRLREGNLQQALKIPPPETPGWDSYRMALACARQEPEASIQALASNVRADDDPEMSYFFAAHLAYCGQTDAALRMLKTAIDGNYCSYPAMDKDPLFNKLRDNPEFKKVRAAGMLCHDFFVAGRERISAAPRPALRSALR
jgi:DNA-binding winged helix-turn-helix (wHTH) protein/TolB-like protein